MIWGIHYFITKLKTKIDVIPRDCFNTKLLYMLKNCCFVIHGALWTLALYGPIFGQGEGYYIRSYYYILYPCSPLILTFLIYLICVSVFALIHRLHSYLSASPSALMLLFYYWPSFCLSDFPATYAVFQKQYITLLRVACMEAACHKPFAGLLCIFYNYLHVCRAYVSSINK